jgi:hypothetical protein
MREADSVTPTTVNATTGESALTLLGALIHHRSTTLSLTIGDDDEAGAGEWWDVTDAELQVFGLDDALYPLCIATLDAYTGFTSEGGDLSR